MAQENVKTLLRCEIREWEKIAIDTRHTLLSPDNFLFFKFYLFEFTSFHLARDCILHCTPPQRGKQRKSQRGKQRKRNPNIGLCHAHQAPTMAHLKCKITLASTKTQELLCKDIQNTFVCDCRVCVCRQP
jgi:hypothetical protein